MNDLEGLNVEELRNLLVTELKYTPEEADETKGKLYMRELITEHRNDITKIGGTLKYEGDMRVMIEESESSIDEYIGSIEDTLDSLSESEDYLNEESNKESNKTPKYASPEWEQYVITQFEEDELYDGKFPTLNGLRRVANNVLGTVLSSSIKLLQRNWEDSSTAYCIYALDIETNFGMLHFEGAADASPVNMSDATGFNIYPVAIAENRAEARAYRKALLLKVVAAEEMKDTKQDFVSVLGSTGEYDEDSLMSDQQKMLIKNKCQQLGVDMDKFLLENASANPTRKDAVFIIGKLNEQQGK